MVWGYVLVIVIQPNRNKFCKIVLTISNFKTKLVGPLYPLYIYM